MKRAASLALALLLLGACRGEPVPRDYQNAPPNMTDPAKSKAETPAGGGMGQASPEPSTGVEGTSTAATTDTTISDTPPVTKTTT